MATHEDFEREDDLEGATDRGFGLIVGGVLLAIAAGRVGLAAWSTGGFALGWLEYVLGGAGLALLLLGLAAPSSLHPLNVAWTMLGLLLFKILNPIALGLIFLLTIVPIGLIRRLFDRDPLNMRFDPSAESYWIERRPPGPAPETMEQQF